MSKIEKKIAARDRRRKSIRKRLAGTTERPRLAVYRSSKHIYAQIIDDTTGRTLASASTLDASFRDSKFGGKKEAANAVGKLLGTRAAEAHIDSVVFDRGGYLYHGRVAALADGARESGLNF